MSAYTSSFHCGLTNFAAGYPYLHPAQLYRKVNFKTERLVDNHKEKVLRFRYILYPGFIRPTFANKFKIVRNC